MATQILRVRFEDGLFITNLSPNGDDGIVRNIDGTLQFVDTSSTGYPTNLGMKKVINTGRIAVQFQNPLFEVDTWEVGFWFNMSDVIGTSTIMGSHATNNSVSYGEGWQLKVGYYDGRISVYYWDGTYYSKIRTFTYVFLVNTTYAVSISKVDARTMKLYVNNVFIETLTLQADIVPNRFQSLWLCDGRHYNEAINLSYDTAFNFLDNVYFYSGGECTEAQREEELYQFKSVQSTHACQVTQLASPPQEENTNIDIDVDIVHHQTPTGMNTLCDPSVQIFSLPNSTEHFTYRIPKGLPLTDSEIDLNFISSVRYQTPDPLPVGGVIKNHVVGTVYFTTGTLSIDTNGNYTGSGDVVAMFNGEKASNRVTIT